jgi:hypothetical protein
MKPISCTSYLVAIVAFPLLACAQGMEMPNKLKNASPEVRAAYGYPPVQTEEIELMDLEKLRRIASPDGAYCANVKTSAPVVFRGRRLVEIPDIKEPDVRLANQLVSELCFSSALDRLEAVTRADPGNRDVNYVVARMTWTLLGSELAERVLTHTLAEHHEFTSAKVLLAGIRFQQSNFAEMVRLLDENEPRAPTDLWIYMNRLRIDARCASRPFVADHDDVARDYDAVDDRA